MAKIPATIGILTWNSGKTLVRCLESVKDFADIVISDGGSTDDTLAIAKRYGATIISQSNPGHPITDFGLERNILLDAAKTAWFFYLDSDETMSPELRDSILTIANDPSPKHFVYQVRYQVTSADLSVKYRTAIPYYQPRFFSTRIGARFIKKVHEKISWDKARYPTGKIEGPWYVPLDIQLDFVVYKEKVNHRLPLMVREWTPSFLGLLKKGVVEPLTTVVKSLVKISYLRLRYSSRELIPLRYEFYRMYSQWVIIRCVWKKFFSR